MTNKLYLIETPEYTLTRLDSKSFAQEIIRETNKNILKNYVYVEKRRIIA